MEDCTPGRLDGSDRRGRSSSLTRISRRDRSFLLSGGRQRLEGWRFQQTAQFQELLHDIGRIGSFSDEFRARLHIERIELDASLFSRSPHLREWSSS